MDTIAGFAVFLGGLAGFFLAGAFAGALAFGFVAGLDFEEAGGRAAGFLCLGVSGRRGTLDFEEVFN